MPSVSEAFFVAQEVEKKLGRCQILQQEMQKPETIRCIGIDGCPSGWCASYFSESGWNLRHFSTIAELVRSLHTDLYFIDIPIGLSSESIKRSVDVKLRSILPKSFKSTVFTAPCRAAVYAPDYREALRVNKAVTGNGISIQAWNLANKIKQTDRILIDNTELRNRIYETHPELCFYLFNGKRPLLYKKKTEKGIRERLDIINRFVELDYETVLDQKKRITEGKLTIDDIIDATVLSLVGQCVLHGKPETLGQDPGTDAEGIPIRIALPHLN